MLLESKNSTINKNKEVIPAAMLYYTVTDPVVKGQKMTKEQLEELWDKELIMKGLVNYEDDICNKLDEDLKKPSYSSNVISVGTTKDGAFKKGSEVCSTETFQKLSEYVNKKMLEIGNRIRQGEIEKKPYKNEDKTGCTYCSYRGVCGFDVTLPGYCYEKVALSKEEAMNQIVM